MAQDLDQLMERRTRLQEQLDEVDTKILDFKKVRRDELLAELKQLGFDGASSRKSSSTSGSVRLRDPNKLCPICEIAGHDARAHRSQGKTKKPFSKDELRDKGLPN